MSEAAVKRVLDLCDYWDGLSKGETSTTRQIREALEPRPSDFPLLHFPALANSDIEELKETLKNPARIFVLPQDSTEFEVIDVDADQLLLWGDEPCE